MPPFKVIEGPRDTFVVEPQEGDDELYDYEEQYFQNVVHPNGECHIREDVGDYTLEIKVETIDGESIGICGIDFYRNHPCNWMRDDAILENAPDDVIDHLLSDDYDNRPNGILLERFFGYDTRLGGDWTANWSHLTNGERVDLLRERLIKLSYVFESFMTDNWKNEEILSGW